MTVQDADSCHDAACPAPFEVQLIFRLYEELQMHLDPAPKIFSSITWK